MRLSAGRVLAANARGKQRCQAQAAELLGDARTIAACNQRECEMPRKLSEDLPRPRQKRGLKPAIVAAPQPVGFIPAGLREARSAVHAIPIRRIVALQVGEPPVDAQRSEHPHVSLRVGVIGIEQRSVPVEQDSA